MSRRPVWILVLALLATLLPARAEAASRYVFPIKGCAVTYGQGHHDYEAADILTGLGCLFVAPIAGRVDEVGYTDTWNGRTSLGPARGGLFVSIVGDDGVRYYGSHLSSVGTGIRRGVRVLAGQGLGRVGTSGSARGTSPHLHFGISWPTAPGVWWVRRGMVQPYPYLQSWRAGGGRSPSAVVFALRSKLGTTPRCRAAC